MIKIGVTGGIGSGKTVVCELLRIHGIPVYDADREAKALNDSSAAVRGKLTEAFGKNLYTNNKLDRKLLAQIIFNDREKLQVVNSIIHPELGKHFVRWTEQHADRAIVAIDASVLFEAGFQVYLDKTITVLAPMETRIERVLKRDNSSREQIVSRINSQMSDEEKVRLSDFVIVNDNHRSLIEQVDQILQKLRKEG